MEVAATLLAGIGAPFWTISLNGFYSMLLFSIDVALLIETYAY